MNSSAPKRILVLAANPKDTPPLRLDEEVREIEAGLERSRERDYLFIKSKWAIRHRDIHRSILDWKPQIIHFCGHGEGEEGLAFENATGQAQLVDGEALAELFKLLTSRTRIECVLLNACHSKIQAKAIARHVEYVIGMSQAISDKAAIEFVVGFYDGLGAGESVEFAYKLGCTAIRVAGTPEYLIPTLLTGVLSQVSEQNSSESPSSSFSPIEQVDNLPPATLSVPLDKPSTQLASPNEIKIPFSQQPKVIPNTEVQRWRIWRRIRHHPLTYVLLTAIIATIIIAIVTINTPPQLSNIYFPSGTFKYIGTSTWSSLRCGGDATGIDTQFQ